MPLGYGSHRTARRPGFSPPLHGSAMSRSSFGFAENLKIV